MTQESLLKKFGKEAMVGQVTATIASPLNPSVRDSPNLRPTCIPHLAI